MNLPFDVDLVKHSFEGRVTVFAISGGIMFALKKSGDIVKIDLGIDSARLVTDVSEMEITEAELPNGVSLSKYVRSVERKIIRKTLATSASREEAALKLGVSVATLYRKLGKKYGDVR